MSNPMIKCLIFDCDGTLVESEYLCNLGLHIKLKQLGLDIPAEELTRRFSGVKFATTLNTIETENGITLPEDFVAIYRQLVAELFEDQLQLCEGVPEALAQLQMPCCVASNGPAAKIDNALRITGISQYFGLHTYSAYDANVWKPEPGLFLYAAEKMGYQPAECLVIEDTLLGVEAAHRANMKAVLFDPKQKYKLGDADFYITDMRQLVEILTSLVK